MSVVMILRQQGEPLMCMLVCADVCVCVAECVWPGSQTWHRGSGGQKRRPCLWGWVHSPPPAPSRTAEHVRSRLPGSGKAEKQIKKYVNLCNTHICNLTSLIRKRWLKMLGNCIPAPKCSFNNGHLIWWGWTALVRIWEVFTFCI